MYLCLITAYEDWTWFIEGVILGNCDSLAKIFILENIFSVVSRAVSD